MIEPSPRQKPGFIQAFPLLCLALIAYNVAMLLGIRLDSEASHLIELTLISGATWSAGWHEALLLIGLALLLIEILKSTRASTYSMFEHMLSMVVFIVFIVEFLIVKGAGTSTFLILGIMSLIDVMGGYAISISIARKDVSIHS